MIVRNLSLSQAPGEPDRRALFEKCKAIDEAAYAEMTNHRDVLRETALVAYDSETEEAPEPRAFGYLIRPQTYLARDQKPLLPAIHLDAVVKSRMRTEEELQAYVDVFQNLILLARQIYDETQDARLSLRVWCRKDHTEERAFYEEFGFAHTDTMLRMARPLSGGAEHSAPREATEVNLDDEDTMSGYIAATKEAFGFPDSPEEMRYRMHFCGARVFTLSGKTYLTTWPIGSGRAATENVFTRKAFRRQGLAAKLLNETAALLRSEGMKTAELNVYENDREAVRLYEKLGYEVQYELLEMTLPVKGIQL